MYTNHNMSSDTLSDAIINRIGEIDELIGTPPSLPSSPPILKRQNGIYRGFLTEQTHLDDYKDKIVRLCTFTNTEIRHLIKNQRSLLTLNSASNLPLFCEIKNTTHILKCNGDLSDNEGFFFTRFIIEDNIVPVFDEIKSPVRDYSVYLKVSR